MPSVGKYLFKIVELDFDHYPDGIYLFRLNNENNIIMSGIFSMLVIKTPERRQWRRSGVLIVNFELIWYTVLVFLLLTLNK